MGLEAGIWASRLGFGPGDWNSRWGKEKEKKEKEKERKKEEEKIPLMCESIGH